MMRRALFAMILLGAVAAHATDPAMPLEPGVLLPPMRGELLSGSQATLPDTARGRTALLLLGFSYDSRFFVEAWAERFRTFYAADSLVTFYEIPVLGGMARVAKPFIDRGMRNGTPAALHGNVLCVWGETDAWKARVGYRDAADAYLLLLDRDGRLVWRYAGPCDTSAWEALKRRMQALGHRGASSAPGTSRD